jgi:hypothetical protein
MDDRPRLPDTGVDRTHLSGIETGVEALLPDCEQLASFGEDHI